MSLDIIQEKVLPIVAAVGNSFMVRALDNDEHSIRIPIALFFKDKYRGKAYITTDPGISQIGDWFHVAEDGNFTNFGAQDALEFDRFYYNGATWDLIPYSEILGQTYDYLTVADLDPAGVPLPPTGYYNMGVYNGSVWIKDSSGTVSYMASDIASDEIAATSMGQTAFTMSRAVGANSLVYHNGSLLATAGWNSVGTTLTLVGPAYTGDIVQVLF